jgi:2-oxoisovalerate dehydrogenase E1 component
VALRPGARHSRAPMSSPNVAREPLDLHLATELAALGGARIEGALDRPVRTGSALVGQRALELFECQIGSRQLDHAARWLRAQGQGFYTIGSAGHEGNAARRGGAAADRSGAPPLPLGRLLPRARAAGGARGRATGRDARGICAAAERAHRGRAPQGLRPPRRSRSSRRPRRSPRTCRARWAWPSRSSAPRSSRVRSPWPTSAIVVHELRRRVGEPLDGRPARSTPRATARTSTCRCRLLFVCEDNGLGISVSTPAGWIRAAYGNAPSTCATSRRTAATWRRGLRGDGRGGASTCATQRRPAFLHLRTVRFLGHAGYRRGGHLPHAPPRSAPMRRDPILATARALLVEAGIATGASWPPATTREEREVREIALAASREPQLTAPPR